MTDTLTIPRKPTREQIIRWAEAALRNVDCDELPEALIRDFADGLSALAVEPAPSAPAEQEPVAWQMRLDCGRWGTIRHGDDKPIGEARPLYTNPAPTPAVQDDVAGLAADCRTAAKVMGDQGTFPTGQDILRQAADALEAQAVELARYRKALQPFASAWRIAQASGLTSMFQLGSLARNEVAAVAFMKAAALTQPTGD